eukprot:COSAG05_NODE_155_length_15704_cov_84.777315_18_plen_104_part_00
MTDIYISFICAHYELHGNAPVIGTNVRAVCLIGLCPSICRDVRSWAHADGRAAEASKEAASALEAALDRIVDSAAAAEERGEVNPPPLPPPPSPPRCLARCMC